MEKDIIINSDAVDALRSLPADSVDMCVTSPPYFGLRDYGVEGQIGLEKTPEQYVKALVGVFSEVRRVLKPLRTLWLNMPESVKDRFTKCYEHIFLLSKKAN